jgi:hypothetical protein
MVDAAESNRGIYLVCNSHQTDSPKPLVSPAQGVYSLEAACDIFFERLLAHSALECLVVYRYNSMVCELAWFVATLPDQSLTFFPKRGNLLPTNNNRPGPRGKGTTRRLDLRKSSANAVGCWGSIVGIMSAANGILVERRLVVAVRGP